MPCLGLDLWIDRRIRVRGSEGRELRRYALAMLCIEIAYAVYPVFLEEGSGFVMAGRFWR